MRALVTVAGNTAAVTDVPKPSPSPTQLLVAVCAIAINPVDALYVFAPSAAPGRTVGSDFCGVVVQCGDAVTGFSAGERVAGFVHGACTETTFPGAFAEYVVVDAALVFRVPADVGDAEAATVPLCFMTAAQALHLRLGIPSPHLKTKLQCNMLLTINGGSTSVGQYAVQLAHLAGCHVIATASQTNSGHVRALGADIMVDYRSKDYPVRLAAAAASFAPSALMHGLDCISEGTTTKSLTDTFDPSGGRCVVLRSAAWRVPNMRKDVAYVYTAVWSMLGVAFSYNRTLFPASPTDYAHACAMYKALPVLLADGRVRPNRVRLMEGGLDGIMGALESIGEGDVSARLKGSGVPSAEKMVFVL